MGAEVPKQVILRSLGDGEEEASNSSVMLKNIIEDGCAESAVPLSNVKSSALAKVIEYRKRHSSSGSADDVAALMAWDEDFIKKMEREELFDVTNAAYYLGSKPLLDLLCFAIAKNIKNMKVEEVRDYLNIENDFTEKDIENDFTEKEEAWVLE